MISLRDVTVQAGDFQLDRIHLDIPAGCYAVLMGKSGCGKTTLLEAICGLRPLSAGQIFLDGRDVTSLRPGERGVGYVPQDGALFTTMTVSEHLAFALRIRRTPKAELDARVGELASALGLEHLLARYPAGLSGGEAQRVALGRALSCRPRILCLDEPLSALDSESRAAMGTLLSRLQSTHGITVLHTTHARDEAQKLAHRVIRLDRSVMIQEGSIGGA